MRTTLMFLVCLAFGLLPVAPVKAQQAEGSSILFVAPSRLVISPGNNVTEINVANRSDVARRYDILVVDQAMHEDGMTRRVETFEYSARRMLRFVPKRFTLKPGERQIVRIMAQRPSGLADGDYHSHMLFREVPLGEKDKADAEPDREPSENTAQFEVRALYGVAVPVIIQSGTVTSDIGFGQVSYIPAADGAPAHVAIELIRTGNAEASGRLSVQFARDGLAPVDLVGEQWIPIYREQDKITRRIPLTGLPAGTTLEGGTMTLTLTRDNPAPGQDATVTKMVNF